MANKVKFGLKNVHIWAIESEVDGKPTYGTALKIPGAVNLSLDAQESEEPFYADDIVYYLAATNSGYSGSLEVALIPDEFRIQVLGARLDDDGVLVEATNDKRKEFAMAFEFDGDQSQTRHVMYRVAASRPSVSGAAVTNSKTPQTDTLNITAMGRADNHLVKASADGATIDFATWYGDAPHEPVFTPVP